jgi:hypothetical protein
MAASFLFLFVLSTLLGAANTEIFHEWNLVFPASVHPEQYAGRTTGHFGKLFVAHLVPRMFPNPDTPLRLRGKPEPGVVQVALLVAKDGGVKDVAVVAQTPDGVFDDAVIRFFKRMVFVSHREGKKDVECETEMILAFRPASPAPK